MEKKNNWKAWLYLAPALVLLAVFTFYPFFKTIGISFLENYDPLAAASGASFKIGIGNFRDVISYSKFKEIMFNTILIVVITVPASTLLALLIAVALNSIKPLQKIFQTIFFLPYVTNSIAIGMVFAMMFNIVGLKQVNVAEYLSTGGQYNIYNIYTDVNGEKWGFVAQSWGIINNLLQLFGINPVNWINSGGNINGGSSTYVANIAVMVVYIVWNALPFKILILLGGLQSVNKQYYDAAKIDGTSRVRTFWRITVPLLSPMLAYVIITGFIGGFKEYSSIVGIFGEGMGPSGNGSLQTIVGYIYDALKTDSYGTASAASLILFGIILIVTLINLYVSSKKVHY